MSLYNIEIEKMNSEHISLNNYKGDVLLIVNTASKCGFTKQFGDLEKLYQKYKEQGFKILGFPCNQFLKQDPGSNEEILEFCTLNFGVTFEMFKKIDVKGKNIHPLFDYLVQNSPERVGKKIKWNFEKFLISKEGSVVHRYTSNTEPFDIETDILIELKK
ncbi:MAG: glutathione peroxidase [Bacilli bacterium]|nr:glutathione peroxidase [Bacilli bacterium]